MFASIFHAVVENKDNPNLRELLESLKPGLFAPLDDDEGVKRSQYVSALLYIVYAYSKESPWRVMGVESAQEKLDIFSKLQISDTLHSDLVLLRNKGVRDTIAKYLEYQADRDFGHLMRKKDLYDTLLDAQLDNIHDGDKVDFKGAMESSKQMDKLMDDIRELEEKFMDRYRFVYANFKELDEKGTRKVTRLELEASHHLRS